MIKSMTGYGESKVIYDSFTLTFVLRSVNHRYQEVVLRLPRELSALEDSLQKEIKKTIKRGRVEGFINLEHKGHLGQLVQVDWDLAKGYYAASLEIKKALQLDGELSINDFIKLPELFTAPPIDNIEHYEEAIFLALEQASSQLIEMRRREGDSLAKDIMNRLKFIEGKIDVLFTRAPQVVMNYRERLEKRLTEFLTGIGDIDENRLINEVALFIDKANIDEELTRLKSHCEQFYKFMTITEPVGRKLDFLLQEMNREVNTIGSKANDLLISQEVVELKSELEKIREQVQNIE